MLGTSVQYVSQSSPSCQLQVQVTVAWIQLVSITHFYRTTSTSRNLTLSWSIKKSSSSILLHLTRLKRPVFRAKRKNNSTVLGEDEAPRSRQLHGGENALRHRQRAAQSEGHHDGLPSACGRRSRGPTPATVGSAPRVEGPKLERGKIISHRMFAHEYG